MNIFSKILPLKFPLLIIAFFVAWFGLQYLLLQFFSSFVVFLITMILGLGLSKLIKRYVLKQIEKIGE